jgi:DNA-binding transcriptional LysR family regulator
LWPQHDGQQILYEPDGITVNDGMILWHLVKAGIGLACIMSDIVRDDVADDSLIRVLDDWCAPFPGYFLYHSSHATCRRSGAH